MEIAGVCENDARDKSQLQVVDQGGPPWIVVRKDEGEKEDVSYWEFYRLPYFYFYFLFTLIFNLIILIFLLPFF